MPAPAVTAREVLSQAVADWLDKEVQAGYTYTYIWMTNQLGHFTLGFGPVLLFDWLARTIWFFCHRHDMPLPPYAPCISYGFAGLLALFWTAKEVRDVIVAQKQAAGHAFAVNSGDLWKDAGTAVFFFSCGIIPAALSFYNPGYALLSFAVLLPAAVVGPAWYWMSRKLCFQRAQLPFLARLADFTSKFSAVAGRVGPREIEAFALTPGPGPTGAFQHLLIFGAAGTGRSTLAVAICTEHTFEVQTGRYTTWSKFQDLDASGGAEDPKHVWPWRHADILVLDDIHERSTQEVDLVIDDIEGQIRCLKDDTFKALRERRVVWVLGPILGDDGVPGLWIEMFADCLDLDKSCFGVVELSGSFIPPKVPVSSLSGH